jgi:hypothetical protein
MVWISARLVVGMCEDFCYCLQTDEDDAKWYLEIGYDLSYLPFTQATALNDLEIDRYAKQQIIKKHKQEWN